WAKVRRGRSLKACLIAKLRADVDINSNTTRLPNSYQRMRANPCPARISWGFFRCLARTTHFPRNERRGRAACPVPGGRAYLSSRPPFRRGSGVRSPDCPGGDAMALPPRLTLILLALLALAPAAAPDEPAAPLKKGEPEKLWLYVGTYTPKGGS